MKQLNYHRVLFWSEVKQGSVLSIQYIEAQSSPQK